MKARIRFEARMGEDRANSGSPGPETGLIVTIRLISLIAAAAHVLAIVRLALGLSGWQPDVCPAENGLALRRSPTSENADNSDWK